jgi:hypothetical protein
MSPRIWRSCCCAPAWCAPPPDLTTSVPDRRSSPAGGGQPRTASSLLVVLPREARDAAALAPTADRPRLDLVPPPAGPTTAGQGPGTADYPPGQREPSLGLPAHQGRTAAPRGPGVGHHDPHLHASSRGRSCASAGGHDLAGVPVPAGRRDHGVRLLHRRHDLATAVSVLFFIELDTPGVQLARVTAHPEGPWIASRPATAADVWGRGPRRRFLIRDRDARCTRAFDDVFRSEGCGVITPVQAPNANTHAERWIRKVRAECLDLLLVTGRRHVEQVLRGYVNHYDVHRPHRALGLEPPNPPAGPTALSKDQGRVHRRDRLGGLLSEYHRRAA